MKTNCSFAFPGTYGHECGAPAVVVGTKRVTSTKTGIYYARRCAKCAAIKGGENIGITSWQPFDEAAHINQWI